jgi:hypothetical protein
MANDEPEDEELDRSAPLTRDEFEEGLRSVHAAFENVATRPELEAFATKADFAAAEERLFDRMDRLGEAILSRIDAAVENWFIDIGATTREHVSSLTESLGRIGERGFAPGTVVAANGAYAERLKSKSAHCTTDLFTPKTRLGVSLASI